MEAYDSFVTEFLFCFSPDRRVVRATIFDEVPENTRQFVSHSSNGLGGTQSGFAATETITQVFFAAPKALSGQAQGQGSPAFNIAGFDGDDFAAGDAIVGAKAQPGGKAFGGGKALHKVGSQFGEEQQAGIDLEARDLS